MILWIFISAGIGLDIGDFELRNQQAPMGISADTGLGIADLELNNQQAPMGKLKGII